MLDAVVIGAGPNGLVAAAALARHGWRVAVFETQPRPGGALGSRELTLPGYIHDVGAGFFPFADSPAFRALDLTGAGLEWVNAPRESCHPAPDGTCVSIARDLARSEESFGQDAPGWRRLVEWGRTMGDRLSAAILAPLPALGPIWRLGPANAIRLAANGICSPAAWSFRFFRTEAARRVVPGLALHVDLGPRDFAGASAGLVLALMAATRGFPVPRGGAEAITRALIRRLHQAGGELYLSQRAERIIVRHGRAVAVRTSAGDEVAVRRAVLADVGAPALYLQLLAARAVPAWLRSRIRRYRYGWGTFKVDWALAGPVPWSAPEARESAVVHAGDSVEDLALFTRQVRAGHLPQNPYMVIGQQSLADPLRAPPGDHTLYAYSHVPSRIPCGWPAARERFADHLEGRIEGLAPGFRAAIRARAIHSPEDLESMNENLVGGDLGGGSAAFRQQHFFRPAFPYFRYRTPVRGLYLASASTHPGTGVHGACGWNAAQAALADAGEKRHTAERTAEDVG